MAEPWVRHQPGEHDAAYDFQILQDNLERAIVPVAAKIQNDSVRVLGVVFVAGVTKEVEHKLGRKFVGFRLTDATVAGTDLIRDSSSTSDPAFTVPLISAVNATIDLEVF